MTLQESFDTIAADALAGHMMLGAAVTDLHDGQLVAAVNPERPLQLASIFKIPVLVTAFRQVDVGKLALDTRYALQAGQKLIGSGILS